MDHIILELIVESESTGESISLPVAVHVTKHIEQFIYTNSIQDAAVPIAYLGNQPIDSWQNLVVVNKSHSVVANSPRLMVHEKKMDKVTATSYASSYSELLITNVVTTDSAGKQKPLFYRHALPDDCVEASLISVINGNKERVEEGYLVDLDSDSIFTNYFNYFDADSGSYRLYYVTAASSDGTTQNMLLNSAPATKEASWEDLDLDTGELRTDIPLYTREKSGSGYSFSFNKGATWFIKPQERGLVQPRRPLSKKPNMPWYLRFTNGDVTGIANGFVHRYRIPEFLTQPFIPFAPIKYGPHEELLTVNKRVLNTTRKTLYIKPELGLHAFIYAEDPDGVLTNIYTTDQSLGGTRYSDTNVFYESDKIASWDNEHGFIGLAVDTFANRTYWAQFYYVVDDYEYTFVNLNPITNKKMKDHTYVFYCVPDVGDTDRAIHHLLVGPDGKVKHTSQSLGLTVPNLQLKQLDGSYNSNTVVGLPYASETEDSFLSLYAAGYANTHAYLILAEVSAIDISVVENQTEIDVRRAAGIVKSLFTEAIGANPRILQSALGYGPAGQVVPQVNVVVIEAPITVLEDYGGDLTTTQAESLLRTHMPVSGHAVIKYSYPKSVLSGWSFTASETQLSATWEGEFDYRFYRREALAQAWDLIHTASSPAQGDVTYVDTTAVTSVVYQYAVALFDGVNEYPFSDLISVKVM